MQAASHGPWATARNAANSIPRNVNGVPRSTRAIHIPPVARAAPTQGTVHKLLQQSRTVLGRFFAHLTAPGLGSVPKAPNYARAFHQGGASNSIKQGLSFPARVALSRPLQPRFSPRGPNYPSRSTVQVGLGAARNFSSSRPLFQNLVENVPIAGRAFLEADWEVKMRNEQQIMHQRARKEKSFKNKSVSRVRETKNAAKVVLSTVEEPVSEVPTYEAEMAHYFPLAAVPEVTTYLLVPLAPTPTSRVPLAALPSLAHPLLPLPELLGIHGEHTEHSIRVSSLFSRLDRAKVWEQGVTCEAYSHGSHIGHDESACTVLKLEFVGWSKAEVRGIIGESGTGWCVLEEVSTSSTSETYDSEDETDSIASGEIEFGYNDNTAASMGAGFVDPSQSVILPTLDFSPSSVGSSTSSSMSLSRASGSDLFESSPPTENEWIIDDFGSESLSSLSSGSPSQIEPPSTNSFFGIGFSSDFIQRQGSVGRTPLDEAGPRETLF